MTIKTIRSFVATEDEQGQVNVGSVVTPVKSREEMVTEVANQVAAGIDGLIISD